MSEEAAKILQHRLTRQFLREDGQWTDNRQEAVTVRTVADALTYTRRFKLDHVDILLTFGAKEYDVRLEIGKP